jgi:NADH:ubiquinone oxidoreductase subunit 4 (subunit M)
MLSVLVWTPAAGALLAALPGEDRAALRRTLSVGFAALSLALASTVAFTWEPGASPRELRRWIPSLGLSYDLFVDGFGSILVLWVALLALLALVSVGSRELGRRDTCLILLAETALLGLATASDGALFLAFYGAGLLVLTLLLGRAEEMKTFFSFQTAGATLAVVYVAISYHLTWVQTGFPSAEIARFSSLVTFPFFQSRMFLLGAAGVAFGAPLFPFTSGVSSATSALTTPGRLLLLGGWSLAGTLFFVRAVLPSYAGSDGALFVMVLAALSLLYAGLAPRRSWAPLLVGFQGLVVLGLLSPTAEGVAAGRAGMLQLALALSTLALWKADSDDARGPAFTSGIALAMFLPASWFILREHWSAAPALTALAGLGLVLSMFRLVRALPPLSRRRSVLLLPLLGFWILSLLAPSRFLPADTKSPATAEAAWKSPPSDPRFFRSSRPGSCLPEPVRACGDGGWSEESTRSRSS